MITPEPVLHTCAPLQALAGGASEITIGRDAHGGFLRYRSFATDQAVRDGEADEVRELLTEVQLRIDYCPFCARALAR